MRSPSAPSRMPTRAQHRARWPSPSIALRRREPGIRVEPDAAASATGWWGHGRSRSRSPHPTAADVASLDAAPLRAIGCPRVSGRLRRCAERPACPPPPSRATGGYQVDVLSCHAAGHCSASPRAGFHWDGGPAAAPAEAFAPPLARRRRATAAHLIWPAFAAAAGASGIAGAFVGTGLTAGVRAPRPWRRRLGCRASRASARRLSPQARHGSARSASPTRLLSGAGIAPLAGVRCAAVDELPPEVGRGGGPWSSGPQTITLAASDSSGAAFAEVQLDGARVAAPGDVLSVAGEGPPAESCRARRRRQRDRGRASARRGCEPAVDRPRQRRLPGARGARRRRRPLSGVALVEVRLAGALLETRLAADGRTALARVPDGVVLDGAAVAVRVADASSPANTSELGVTLPVRPLPGIRGLSVSNAGVTGRVVAAQTGTRVQVWAYPRAARRACSARTQRVPTARSRCAYCRTAPPATRSRCPRGSSYAACPSASRARCA